MPADCRVARRVHLFLRSLFRSQKKRAILHILPMPTRVLAEMDSAIFFQGLADPTKKSGAGPGALRQKPGRYRARK